MYIILRSRRSGRQYIPSKSIGNVGNATSTVCSGHLSTRAAARFAIGAGYPVYRWPSTDSACQRRVAFLIAIADGTETVASP
ncbi:hypothetical protein [Streptomyces sp. NPDC005244]|uniref:hypothetical protein n=1 Tax=Streptomyces sp. NPDC005244 TaxID=3364708 RepID=UPI00369C226A